MSFQIPNSELQIRQSNRGDLFGELWETFNIDLTSNPGKILNSKKLELVLGDSVLTGAAGLHDLLIFDGRYYAFTEDETFVCSVGDDPSVPGNWSIRAAVGDNDINTTAVVFDGLLRISLDTDIARYNGGASYADDWWTEDVGGTALTAGFPHVTETVQSQKETFFVTDKNLVHYLEKGGSPKIVTLDSNVVACCLAPALSGSMWVGTYNETSGKAYVYEIYVGEVVGSTAVYRQAYPIDAQAVLAIWVVDNTPYIVTEKGTIQVFNGAGFKTIAYFPFIFNGKDLDGVSPGLIQDSNRARPIHPRGVKVVNDIAFLLVNSEDTSTTDTPVSTRFHSGVWEFNTSNSSLSHRAALADTANDYGASILDESGALLVTDNADAFLMCGAGATDTGLYVMKDTPSQGWFVTPELNSDTIQSAYNKITHKATTLGVGETINTLYRTRKRETIRGTANWVSATEFVTTDDWSGVVVGDLVRVNTGYGTGDWGSITAITTSATTYTVTLNRSIGLADATSKVYSDNFKLISAEMTTAGGEFKTVGVGDVNPWVQFMVILKGEIEYRSFDSKDNAKTTRS